MNRPFAFLYLFLYLVRVFIRCFLDGAMPLLETTITTQPSSVRNFVGNSAHCDLRNGFVRSELDGLYAV
jgi:hypothetical protein